jgi:hypothetical protein
MAAPNRFYVPADPLLERAEFDIQQIRWLAHRAEEVLADLALAAEINRHSWPIVQLADEAAALHALQSLGGNP